MFNPAPLVMPGVAPLPEPVMPEAMPIPAPVAPPPITAPIMPSPKSIQIVVKKPKSNEWGADIVRRAQGLYPAEAQAKAAQMESAKMPTPTGAWGAPK